MHWFCVWKAATDTLSWRSALLDSAAGDIDKASVVNCFMIIERSVTQFYYYPCRPIATAFQRHSLYSTAICTHFGPSGGKYNSLPVRLWRAHLIARRDMLSSFCYTQHTNNNRIGLWGNGYMEPLCWPYSEWQHTSIVKHIYVSVLNKLLGRWCVIINGVIGVYSKTFTDLFLSSCFPVMRVRLVIPHFFTPKSKVIQRDYRKSFGYTTNVLQRPKFYLSCVLLYLFYYASCHERSISLLRRMMYTRSSMCFKRNRKFST